MDIGCWISTTINYVKLPQRVIICIFGFLAIVNAFVMRHSMDIVLPKILPPKVAKVEIEETQPAYLNYFRNLLGEDCMKQITAWKCLSTDTNFEAKAKRKSNYDVNGQVRTAVMISFYMGYIITHVPGGLLAERYGGKWVLAVSVAVTAFLTILTPLAINYCSIKGLISIRFLMGLSEGPLFPALNVMMVEWVPARERGTLGSFVLSAGHIGILVANLMTAILMPYCEWSLIFYFFGVCALLWFVCFITLCYSDPESNPYIKETERSYLRKSIGSTAINKLKELETNFDSTGLSTALISTSSKITNASRAILPSVPSLLPSYDSDVSNVIAVPSFSPPWREIFTNGPMWALIAANIQHDWSQTFWVSEIRHLIDGGLAIDFRNNFCSCLKTLTPFMLNWVVSCISGVIGDMLVNENILDTTESRRLMTLIAAFGPKICSNFSSCLMCYEQSDFSNIFNCAISAVGAYYAGVRLTSLDMSPRYAGTLMAISNSLGSISNLIAPFLEEFITQPGPMQNVRSLVWFLCTMFTSGEIQSFNGPVGNDEYEYYLS
uniref:Major facilitator superfamily (MFS) profile domain-containing protein n=1 Tax=Glossina pallidipes TaxID=7398 RepID=A0A1A9Z8Q8_GLOPL